MKDNSSCSSKATKKLSAGQMPTIVKIDGDGNTTHVHFHLHAQRAQAPATEATSEGFDRMKLLQSVKTAAPIWVPLLGMLLKWIADLMQ